MAKVSKKIIYQKHIYPYLMALEMAETVKKYISKNKYLPISRNRPMWMALEMARVSKKIIYQKQIFTHI